ncbi:MAG: hypothetical protein Tsb0014_29290 [Pleurocapsa sp.]
MSINTETSLKLQTSDVLSNNLLTSVFLVEDLLSDLASDENQFHGIFFAAFDDIYDIQDTEAIRLDWLARDFSATAPIEIRSSEELNGSNGAFASQTNRIYLATNFLAQANQEDITSVLIEEIGHWVDNEINLSDTPGDEGEYFASTILGHNLSELEWNRIKAEDDSGIVILDNYSVEIEQATNNDAYINNSSTDVDSPSFSDTFRNGDNATGYYYNGKDGGTGELYNGHYWDSNFYNGYNNGTGYFYNGKDNGIGKLRNGWGAKPTNGYFYNGYDGGIGYFYNGYDGGIGELYNGSFEGQGYFYNGTDSGTGYFYNGTNGTIFNDAYIYGVYQGGVYTAIYRAYRSSFVNNGYLLNDGVIENESYEWYENKIYFGQFFNNGTLAGNGIFKGGLYAEKGVIAPGGNSNNNYTDTDGTFTFEGDLYQTGSAILSLSLSNSTSYDHLIVTGNATFDGGSIELVNFENFSNSSFASGITEMTLIDGENLSIDSSIVNNLSSFVDSYDINNSSLTLDFSIVVANNDLKLTVDKNQAPINVTLSNNVIDENTEDLTVGSLGSNDPDGDTNLTYTLVSGEGDTDNASFSISNNQLMINNSPDFEAKDSYSIRVQTKDPRGLFSDEAFTITVNDVNEAPTVVNPIDDRIFIEESEFSFSVPETTFSDIDTGDNLTYTATLADGTELPKWLNFDAATRTFKGMPTNTNVGTLDIKVTATDSSSASAEDVFTLEVQALSDLPILSLSDLVARQNTDATMSLTLSNSESINQVEYELAYNSDLLDVNAVTLDESSLPDNWQLTNSEIDEDNGLVKVKLEGSDPLSGDNFKVTDFDVSVPNNLTYGTNQTIELQAIKINGEDVNVNIKNGTQLIAQLGDVTGDNQLSKEDAYQMMRVSVGLDEGFDRFSTVDPIIMADMNQDGVISAFDAHFATKN